MADKEKEFIRAAISDDKWMTLNQERHVRRVEKAVSKLERRIISSIKQLETRPDGRLHGIKVNMIQAQAIQQDVIRIFEDEWYGETNAITDEYRNYQDQITKTYGWLDESVRFTSVDQQMMDTLQQGAWQNFVVSGDQAKEKVIQAVYNDVIGGGHFSELVKTIEGSLGGAVGASGVPLVNYARLYARDNLANFMREVNVTKSEDIGITQFYYMGDVIATTRSFCRQRVGKTYTKDQINSWTYKWQGKSGPAMTNCGGWNCRHHWRGVKPEWFEDGEAPPVGQGPKPKPKPKAKAKPKAKPKAAPKKAPQRKDNWELPTKSTEQQFYEHRSVWDKAENYLQAKRQFSQKYKLENIKVNDALTKTSKGKLEYLNEFGEVLADAVKRNPGISRMMSRKGIVNVDLTSRPNVGQQYKALTRQGSRGLQGYYYKTRGKDPVGKLVASLEQADDAITLGQWTPSKGRWNTVMHELGHHYDRAAKPQSFNRTYNRFSKTEVQRTVGKYASSDSEEGWAELFQLYCSPKFKPDKHAKSLSYFGEFMNEVML